MFAGTNPTEARNQAKYEDVERRGRNREASGGGWNLRI
jgi:hypothetical protein